MVAHNRVGTNIYTVDTAELFELCFNPFTSVFKGRFSCVIITTEEGAPHTT